MLRWLKTLLIAIALLTIPLGRSALHAAPPLIGLTCTVYNVDGTPAVGASFNVINRYTQNIGGVILRPGTKHILTGNNGQIPLTDFVQTEEVAIQVDNGTATVYTFPAEGNVDCSALIPVTSNPTGVQYLTGIAIASGGQYSLFVTNPPAGSSIATLTPGNLVITGGPCPGWVDNYSAGLVCSSAVIAPVTTPSPITVSGATATINFAAGSEQLVTLSANSTITLSGGIAGQHLFVTIKYTGTFTPTFSAAGSDRVDYGAAGAPSWTATNNKVDVVGFAARSNGTGITYAYVGSQLGQSL